MTQLQLEGLLFWFPAFVFSTTLHEAAHAWTALRAGDPTAYRGGQVSLSPWPHIRREPLGMLVIPLVTALSNGWAIGWASAPFDPVWAARHPRRAAVMAAAGPLANVVLAVAALAAIRLGMAAGWWGPGPGGWSALVVPADPLGASTAATFAARGLSVLLSLNALLAAFNLVPLPPLDGAAVIDIVLPPRLAGVMRRLGPAGSMIGLLLAWRLFPMWVGPIHALLARLVGA
jgi:Zn-dependent protease